MKGTPRKVKKEPGASAVKTQVKVKKEAKKEPNHDAEKKKVLRSSPR
jgi:hypothetical protein